MGWNLPDNVCQAQLDKYWEEHEMDANDIIISINQGIESLERRLDRERDRAIGLLNDGLLDAALTAVVNAQAAKAAIDELTFQLDEIEVSRG